MSEPTKTSIGAYAQARRLDEPGEVYLAQSADGQSRRLRLFAPAAATEAWETISRETAICAQLDHAAILAPVETFKVDDQLAVAFEHIDGIRLDALLDRRRAGRRLERAGVWYLAQQVMGALAQAHSAMDAAGDPATICHGHLSPEQIIITRDGSVRLDGLGLAALASTEGVAAPEVFTPPEQAKGQRPTPRGDIYSAAVVTWSLLVGREPTADDLPFNLESVKLVPEQLADALKRALEPAVAIRRITAMELEQWFGSHADEETGQRALRMSALGVAVRTSRPPPPRPMSAPPRPGRPAAKGEGSSDAANASLPKLRSRLPTLEGVGPLIDELLGDESAEAAQDEPERQLSDVAGLDQTVTLQEAMAMSPDVAPAPKPVAEASTEPEAVAADSPGAPSTERLGAAEAAAADDAEPAPSDEGLAATVALDADAPVQIADLLAGELGAPAAAPADAPPKHDLAELQATVALDDAFAAVAPAPEPVPAAGQDAPAVEPAPAAAVPAAQFAAPTAPDGSPWADASAPGPDPASPALAAEMAPKKRSWASRFLLPIIVGLVTMGVVMAAGVWLTRSRLTVDEPPEPSATTAAPTGSTSTPVEPSTGSPTDAATAPAEDADAPALDADASASDADTSPDGSAAASPVEDDGSDGKNLPPTMGLIRASFDAPPDAQVYWNGKPVGAIGRKIEVPCGAAFVRVGKMPGPTWLSQGQSVQIKCRALTEIKLVAP